MHRMRTLLLTLAHIIVSCAAAPFNDPCLPASAQYLQNASQAADSRPPGAVLLWVTCVGSGSLQPVASAGAVRNCAGTLVKENWIVTAAECVSCHGGDQVSVTADIGALTNDIRQDLLSGNAVQRISVDKVVFHPDYVPGGTSHTVALLHLNVRISEVAKIVARFANCSDSLSQLTLQSSEWLLQSGGAADRLALVNSFVTLWPNDTCRKAAASYFPGLLCVGGADSSSSSSLPENASRLVNYFGSEQCFLKKGSPLLVGKPMALRSSAAETIRCEWQLAGLLSVGVKCNSTGPSLFVSLCRYGAWFESTIQTENERFEVFAACPSPPQAPTNGYLCPSDSVDVRSGGIRFCCNHGFKLAGSASPSCNLASKRWEPETPQCEPVKCVQLPSLEHGSAQPLWCSNSSYLSSCLFSCEEGYRMVGSGLLTCGPDGNWNGRPPQCIAVNCGPPPYSNSLRVQYSTTEFGASAMYQCNDCFRSVGGGGATTQKQCNASGRWEGASPVCEAIRCLPIIAPLNGGMSQPSSACGSSVRFYCNEGYLLSGVEETVCLMSGEWSNPIPICRSISCPAPSIEGSNFNFSNHRFLYGRSVHVECDNCRQLDRGDGWLTCETSGYWDRPLPHCTWISCPPPPSVPNLIMDPPGSLYYCDTTVQFSCSDGYHIEGAVTSTCQSNGVWSSAFPTCKKVICPLLSLRNGEVHTVLGLRNISHFTCDPCFKLNGPRVVECTKSGTWNDTIPTCDLILCSPLKPIAYGYAVPSLAENRCSSSVVFLCHEGYTLSGPTSIRCGSDGMWDQPQPTCQAVMCPLYPPPKDNSYVCSPLTPAPQFGATVKYCCLDGFMLAGGHTGDITCTEDGVWSAAAPVCQATACLTPPTPSNGALSITNFGGVVAGPMGQSYHGYGSQATFRCNAGYVLIGEGVVTCGSGGTWNHLPPICQMSQCSYGCQAPPIPTNGRLANVIYPPRQLPSNSTYTLGSVAVFTCSAGYYLAGSGSRTCLENGVWSDQVTRCYPFDQPRSKLLYKIGDTPWQSNDLAYLGAMDRVVIACQTQLKETGTVQLLSKLSGPALDRNVRVVQSGSPDSSLQLSLQPLTAAAGLSMAGVYKCQVRSTADGSIVLVELLRVKVYVALCPVPMAPANGGLLTTGTSPGSCSLYSCSDGYTLVGSETSICRENGTWTTEQPVCVPITDRFCDPPVVAAPVVLSPPPNTGGRYRAGDTVVYSCNLSSYRLVGANGAVCLSTSDYAWSAPPPICIATA